MCHINILWLPTQMCVMWRRFPDRPYIHVYLSRSMSLQVGSPADIKCVECVAWHSFSHAKSPVQCAIGSIIRTYQMNITDSLYEYYYMYIHIKFHDISDSINISGSNAGKIRSLAHHEMVWMGNTLNLVLIQLS